MLKRRAVPSVSSQIHNKNDEYYHLPSVKKQIFSTMGSSQSRYVVVRSDDHHRGDGHRHRHDDRNRMASRPMERVAHQRRHTAMASKYDDRPNRMAGQYASQDYGGYGMAGHYDDLYPAAPAYPVPYDERRYLMAGRYDRRDAFYPPPPRYPLPYDDRLARDARRHQAPRRPANPPIERNPMASLAKPGY